MDIQELVLYVYLNCVRYTNKVISSSRKAAVCFALVCVCTYENICLYCKHSQKAYDDGDVMVVGDDDAKK